MEVVNSLKGFYGAQGRSVLVKHLLSNDLLPVITRETLINKDHDCVFEVDILGSTEYIRLERPKTVGELPNIFQEKIGKFEIPPPFVARLRNIQLIGPNALPITLDNSIIVEGMEGSFNQTMDAILRCFKSGTIPLSGPVENKYDSAVSLVGPWSKAYFHWFIDYLPRLVLAKEHINKADIDPVYIIPSEAPSWLLRSLELLNVPSEKLVSWTGGRVEVENLILPSYWRHSVRMVPKTGPIHSPNAVTTVSNQLLDGVQEGHATSSVGSKLFVSRSKARRHFIDENTLGPILKSYGFDIVHPEDWTLDQQIATFAEADVIAGPHGAGLTNAIYASNPAIIEILGPHINTPYFVLYDGKNWDYGILNADVENNEMWANSTALQNIFELLLK